MTHGFAPEFWIQLLVALGSLIVFLTTLAFYIGKAEGKFATKQELKEKVLEREERIQSVYKKLEEHRNECKQDFVRKDMCGQLHQFNKDEIAKIATEAKDFRHDMMATVGKIYLTIDSIKDQITELKEIVIAKK